jgi:hypothetical protein
LPHRFDELGGTVGVLIQLADDVGGRIGRLRQLFEVELNDAPDFVVESGVGTENLAHAQEEAACDTLEHGGREAALAAKVVMQERLVDAGFVGDFLHAGAGGSAPHEHDVRRVEDAALGIGIAFGFLSCRRLNHTI